MRFFALFTGIAILAMTCGAQSHGSAQKSIEQREKELVRLNGPGTDAALRSELLAMGRMDQKVRKPFESMFAKGAATDEARVDKVNRAVAAKDERLTQELKDIVADHGWPTISLVGAEASSAAAIILVHSPDSDFQRRVLPELESLVDDGKIIGADVAVLIDNLLLGEGKLQRFGTKFDVANGAAVLLPVEDAAHVDELRAKYMLPPIAEFTKSFGVAFHVAAK